jgi:hypothetical protein
MHVSEGVAEPPCPRTASDGRKTASLAPPMRHRARVAADTIGAMSLWCLGLCGMAVVVTSAGAGARALGPQVDGAKPKSDQIKRVEGGVGDVDPLGISLKQLSVDLRQPVGFGGVYQVPASRSPTGRPAFARMSGATTAVFDQSTYVPSRGGPTAGIPPGTVFYIGGLPRQAPTQVGDTNVGLLELTQVDMRAPLLVDTTAGANKVQASPVSTGEAANEPQARSPADRVASAWPKDAGASAPPSDEQRVPAGANVWGDETYRAARVTQLLREAVRLGAKAGEPPAK